MTMNAKWAALALCLCLASGPAMASKADGQVYSGHDWGSVVGTTYVTAKACGATATQLDAYKARALAKGRTMDTTADYPAKFERGFRDAVTSMTPLMTMGGGKPPAESCKAANGQLAQ